MLELLVVLIILLMVTAAAIPLIAPALDNRRMREAARLTSTFISGARSRAIQTGREVGVVIERFDGNPYAMSLAYVEVPPPYGGDTLTSRVRVLDGEIIGFVTGDAAWQNLVRYGDRVKLAYKGPRYLLSQYKRSPYSDTSPDPSIGQTVPTPGVGTDHWYLLKLSTTNEPFSDDDVNGLYDAEPYTDTDGNGAWDTNEPFEDTNQNGSHDEEAFTDMNGNGVKDSPGVYVLAAGAPYAMLTDVAFQIFRQPLRSSDTPMQLPEGIVIDLMYSGEGLAGYWGDPLTINLPPSFPPPNWTTNPPVPYDPVITFTPGGSVGHVGTTAMARPTGPIYLLLGRRELVPDVARIKPGNTVPEDKNIFDSDTPEPENLYLRNFWISIGHQTGLVTTAENTTNPGPGVAGFMQSARAIARTAQSLGGK